MRKAGNGYKALCPAHDDKNPSLSIAEGDGGRVIVNCFAGCTFESIRDALWPQGIDTAPKPLATAEAAPKPRNLPDGPYDTVSLYHYTDGTIVFASVRHQPPGKAKRFSQWTPAEGGQWFDHNPLKTLPLYRLPHIKDADKVVVVEGEKCVHAVLDAWPDMAVTTYGWR